MGELPDSNWGSWKVFIEPNSTKEEMPLFSSRINNFELNIKTNGKYKLFKYKDIKSSQAATFHPKCSNKNVPLREKEKEEALKIKSEIVATLMCLVVQEKFPFQEQGFHFTLTI